MDKGDDTGASAHAHTHPGSPPPLTQDSPSQASLKYCGFSMMWPWSPEPLPSVGDKELPPNVMKCRDMASPSSGASTAAPGEATQPYGGVTTQVHTPAPVRLQGTRQARPVTCRGGAGERGSEAARRGRGGTMASLCLAPAQPQAQWATKELAPPQSSDLPDPLSV